MTLSKKTEVIFDWRRGVEYHSANPPPYDLSTFHQTSLGGNVKYDYTRSGNPNRELLEERLVRLEQGKFALVFVSGIAATSAVFLTFKPGDHVILPGDVCGGTFRLTEQVLNRFSIESVTVDTTKFEQIEGTTRLNTELIYVETPLNLCFKTTDIKAVFKIAEKHELLVVVDNTSMTLLGQSPLLLGADIVTHSATKFLNGHNDLTAGAVITNNEAMSEALCLVQNGTGSMLFA